MSAPEGNPSPPGPVGQASQNGHAPAAPPATATGKPEIFRSPVAPVIWWVWVVFAAANLIDLAVQGRDHFAVVIAAILLLITGVTYVAAFRPRVLADEARLRILNPLRDHQVSWSSVDAVDLGDSLQVHCSWRELGGTKTKTLYGWAVHSPRRSRLKAEMRHRRSDLARRKQGSSYGVTGYGQLPQSVRASIGKTDAEHIVAMLEKHATKARSGGLQASPPESSWHWFSVAALIVPAVLLTIAALT